jgi:hypothetical protein
MLTENDDLRHDLGDDPDARESMVWNVLLPAAGRYAIGYVTIKPSAESTRLLVVFGGDEDPIIDIAADRPFEGRDLDAFTIAGMHIEQPERLRTMTVAYEGERASLRYRFRALHEAFDFARNDDGCAPVAATNRFEQAGRIDGTLSIDGESTHFATTGHRDHSWGVRDYDAIQHWKWISAQAGSGTAIHAMHTWFQGRQYTNGYVLREGLLSPVVDLRVRTDYDASIMQRRAAFTLRDAAGRTTEAEAESFASGFLPFGGVVMAEAGCRFTIAGADGIGVFEQGWPPTYLEYLRHRSLASTRPTASRRGDGRHPGPRRSPRTPDRTGSR